MARNFHVRIVYQRIPNPDLRPLCRGALPSIRHSALTGCDTFKTLFMWGPQGVASLRSALPWAEIPLPL